MISPGNNPVASAHRRIAALAAATPVHRAFHWLHLHQPQIRSWLLDLVRIPAPSFAEADRAQAMLTLFRSLGLAHPHLDQEGNALAELPSATAPSPDPPSLLAHSLEDRPTAPDPSAASLESISSSPLAPVLLVAAHLDTVFPAGTPCHPTEEGTRILAPGACDNAAGLSALLALAASFQFASIAPPATILFCASTGEEGEGNLRGMRHLFTAGPYAHRIAAAIILDGAGESSIVTRALGSQRFRLTVTGPGGHSWTDAGAPNPILLLARILTDLADLPLAADPRTTLNAGIIAGGTSVNAIPASASVQLDLRSTDPETLLATAALVRHTAEQSLLAASQRLASSAAVSLHFDQIGDRPAASLPPDSPLFHTLHAVDRHLGLRSDLRIGSTDANLPLSLGIPAVALGTGGTGGGIHTLAEWYDPTGRETALRRILLATLDTASLLVAPVPPA